MQTGLSDVKIINFLSANFHMFLSDIILMLFRHKKPVASTTPSMKQNCSAFSFKSDERAERRKEASIPTSVWKVCVKDFEIIQLRCLKFVSVLNEAGGENACKGSRDASTPNKKAGNKIHEGNKIKLPA